MNIRKTVEILIYFYISVVIIVYVTGILITIQMQETSVFDTKYLFVFLANHSPNIVVAIWLFFFARKMKHNYILWVAFALVSHIFAAVIFLVLLLLEKYNENKTISTPDLFTKNFDIKEKIQVKNKSLHKNNDLFLDDIGD